MSGAPQPHAASSRQAPSAVGRLIRLPGTAVARSAWAVGAVGAVAFLWRLLAWPPAASVDAWAYAAWGQALARAERPLFDLGATTPKPLAAALGLLVVPLPPARAFGVVVALALGALVGALFGAALREGGAVAAVAAVAAFVATSRLASALGAAYGDVVVAALAVLGVALRGRGRIAAFVLAGLLRPEAWVVAAVAGFAETGGSRRRRVAGALLAGAAAPLLWVLADLALIGDPLGSWHWHRERLGGGEPVIRPWTDVPGEAWSALWREGAAWLTLVGLLGLAVHTLRARRRVALDLVPLAVVVVWTVLPAVQFRYGANLQPRYLLPAVAVLALGFGLLAGEATRRLPPLLPRWSAVVAAVTVVVAFGAVIEPNAGLRHAMERNRALAATRPTVLAVLSCGRFGVTPRAAHRGVVPQLAASTRRSLDEFGVYPRGKPFAGVLHTGPRIGRADRLPPWPVQATPLGPLALAPACRAPGGPAPGPRDPVSLNLRWSNAALP